MMEIQKTTGTLSPGAHAGSYNGQDAYNDMLVVDDGSNIDQQKRLHDKTIGGEGRCNSGIGIQGTTSNYRGGVEK